jgi:hypothetical protein
MANRQRSNDGIECVRECKRCRRPLNFEQHPDIRYCDECSAHEANYRAVQELLRVSSPKGRS